MTPIAQLLSELISKPLSMAFHEESTLIEILKRRLTKKEYKLLMARLEGHPGMDELMNRLAIDEDRSKKLWQNVIKKLNNDAIKREFYSY